MNPDADVSTETRNHWKTLRKKQKTTTYWQPKEYSKPKYKLSVGLVFTFNLPEGFRTPSPRQLRH